MELLRSTIVALLPLSHLFLALLLNLSALFITLPALPDVTMAAVCPGLYQCSQAIYLTGLQQAITGIGAMIATPILGQLSDKYGRKQLLLIPFITSFIPSAILAYSRTKKFFYAYFVVRVLVSIVADGSINCICAAYVADTVEGSLRGSAYAALSGVISIGYVFSILCARFLSESQVFKISMVLSMVGALCLKLFVVEPSTRRKEQSTPKILCQDSKSTFLRVRSCFKDILDIFKMSPILLQVIIISFFSNLGEEGLCGTLFYYLKAKFKFEKREFSELMLVSGVASVISQALLMPFLVQILGETRTLCIGLFANFSNALLYGIAWTHWVPYLATSTSLLSGFVVPSIASIISKEAGPEEQGKVQGNISGIRSFAAILSPFAITPLTALFLSDNPPFHFQGFGIICVAGALLLALIQGCFMRQPAPSISQYKESGYVNIPSTVSEHQDARDSSPLMAV